MLQKAISWVLISSLVLPYATAWEAHAQNAPQNDHLREAGAELVDVVLENQQSALNDSGQGPYRGATLDTEVLAKKLSQNPRFQRLIDTTVQRVQQTTKPHSFKRQWQVASATVIAALTLGTLGAVAIPRLMHNPNSDIPPLSQPSMSDSLRNAPSSEARERARAFHILSNYSSMPYEQRRALIAREFSNMYLAARSHSTAPTLYLNHYNVNFQRQGIAYKVPIGLVLAEAIEGTFWVSSNATMTQGWLNRTNNTINMHRFGNSMDWLARRICHPTPQEPLGGCATGIAENVIRDITHHMETFATSVHQQQYENHVRAYRAHHPAPAVPAAATQAQSFLFSSAVKGALLAIALAFVAHALRIKIKSKKQRIAAWGAFSAGVVSRFQTDNTNQLEIEHLRKVIENLLPTNEAVRVCADALTKIRATASSDNNDTESAPEIEETNVPAQTQSSLRARLK